MHQITRREAEDIGIADSPEIPMREVFNKRTGEIKSIPSGIDPGWECNPGQYRQRRMEQFLQGTLDNADPAIAHAAARDMASSWRMRRIHEGSASGSVPVRMLPRAVAERLGAKTRVVSFSDATVTRARSAGIEVAVSDIEELAVKVSEGLVDDDGQIVLAKPGGLRWVVKQRQTLSGFELLMMQL